jgi:hypothetical protein
MNTTSPIEALVSLHGETARGRATTGVDQVALFWRESDGDDAAFEAFCTEHFIADDEDVTRLLARLETTTEHVRGHLYEMRRTLRRWDDLVGDTIDGVDSMLATFDPAPDLSEQWFEQKLAFVAILNFERATLQKMLAEGGDWSNDQWAAARIANSFGPRIPKEVNDLARDLGHSSSHFISNFHVPVGTMIDEHGKRWFEADRELLAHWLIREEMKAGYNDPDGLAKQRALAWVMARHIDGTIPKAVMESTATGDWDPKANTIGGGDPGDLIGPVRYEHWLNNVTVARALDEYHPEFPTAIDRKFNLEREIPEQEVEQLLIDLLRHPVRRDLAALLSERLGRSLEAHDIYFDDLFEARSAEDLNAIVKSFFKDEAEFEAKLPEVLRGLGYSDKDAEFLGSRVKVEIARGSGHAMRPYLTQYGAWLRTNRLKDELGWDGFDTAMHELGHNLEQLCSTYFAPRASLRGVPNTACTEAFAFLYQGLAKRVLGIEEKDDADRAFHEETIASILMACQIAGPSLVELRTWRWIYENPTDVTPETIRAAQLAAAKDVWSEFFQEDFGPDPYNILAAYQHQVGHPLYLCDYAIGRTMGHQIRSYMRGKDLASETIRITSIGSVTPDKWMRDAVGHPLSIDPLVSDAAEAIEALSTAAAGD